MFLQGTEKTLIDQCIFDRLDGNGLMISGYNRRTVVRHSDFSFLGGTAIASWGYTNETDTDPGRPGIQLENAPAAGIGESQFVVIVAIAFSGGNSNCGFYTVLRGR